MQITSSRFLFVVLNLALMSAGCVDDPPPTGDTADLANSGRPSSMNDGGDGPDDPGDTDGGVNGSDGGSNTADDIDVCGAWDGPIPAGAFAVTPSDKANLQSLLDTHKILKLAPGDYRNGGPSSIKLSSDQAIVALSPTPFPDVIVAAGTTHARLSGMRDMTLSFEPGASIRYNCFSYLKGSGVSVQGATVERNLFLSMAEGSVSVDTSGGGAFSDNRFIKINSHDADLPIRIKGDAARSSGGNSFLLVDSQTPPGSAFSVDGQKDISFVGLQAEAYNWHDQESAPFALKVTNTGTFRGYHASGIVHAGTHVAPAFVFEAETVILHDFAPWTEAPRVSLSSSSQRLFSWGNGLSPADFTDQNASGLRVSAQDDGVTVRVGGNEITAAPAADTNTAIRDLLSPARTGASWGLPKFGAIPDPNGANWAATASGKPDESGAVQALVNSQGVAQLEARTYYISNSIKLGANQGLVGDPSGKTSLVATSNGLDMIDLDLGSTTAGFTLVQITLQGGANGIRSRHAGDQLNQAVISHVTFRDMAHAGIFVDACYGWDNNVLQYVNYVDCAYGFYQEGQPNPGGGGGEWSTMAYIDKVVFYRNQFVHCGQGLVLHPTRANNLDGVVECLFQDNTQRAVDANDSENTLLFASDSFVDNAGDPAVRSAAGFVNCSFVAGPGKSMLGPGADIEGSVFSRGTSTDATIFGNVPPGDVRDPHYFNIANSVSTDMPIGAVGSTVPIAGLYFNNTMPTAEPYAAFMTALEYFSHGTPDSGDDSRATYTLITGAATPGSQLLYGAAWTP